MGIIDPESLLAEISAEAPCGEDLSDEAAYGELERTAQGTPEQEMGEEVIAAEEPNWLNVANQALELLQRTKDLRLLLYLTLAGLRLEGFSGLRDGLAALRGVLDKYWDHVHPQLDPEDDNDPMERMNILASLTQEEASYQDPFQFIRRVRDVALCNSRRMGRFSARDVARIRDGEMVGGEEGGGATLEQVAAAFRDSDTLELQGVAQAAQEVAEHVRAIDSFLTLKCGADQTPNFANLQDALAEVGQVLDEHLGVPAGTAEGEAEGEAGDAAEGEGPKPRARPGEVRSRQDVLVALDNICRYYGAHEPSSPVPLLLRRAQSLVTKNFGEIMQDLAPDSVTQLEGIFGPNSIASQEE